MSHRLALDGKEIEDCPLPPELRQDAFQWFALRAARRWSTETSSETPS